MWFNQFKTVILLSGLSAILMMFGGYVGGQSGVFIALLISLAMNFFSYFYSDTMVLNMYNAQPLDKNKYTLIYNIVEELAQKLNIPMPKLYLINTPMANAFATGRNPNHASVAVTAGILQILDARELRAVLSHELSHVINRDILVSTIAATMATAITYLANSLKYINILSDDSSNQQRRNPITSILLIILMPIAASLIQLAISRSREYMADESGAELCEDPLALASALEKISGSVQAHPLNNEDPRVEATAHMFIHIPFIPEGLSALFSTHPSVKDRVAKLKQIYLELQKK